MKLPWLTKLTRKINDPHHTTEARTEHGELLFSFRQWLVTAKIVRDPNNMWIGAQLKQDPHCAVSKYLDICFVPTLSLRLNFTDFG